MSTDKLLEQCIKETPEVQRIEPTVVEPGWFEEANAIIAASAAKPSKGE